MIVENCSAAEIKKDILTNLFCHQGKFPEVATLNDWYLAVAQTVRDRMMKRWISSSHAYFEKHSRTVVYLSAEFLIGPQLENNMLSLGITEQVREALMLLRLDYESIINAEEEPGLGNGGLGRLAACFLDSLATMRIPAIGYGIRYEFGIFDQEIRDGWQVEITDKWLHLGNPWEIPRPDINFYVKFGGHTECYIDDEGKFRVRWIPDRMVVGTPFDTCIPGYRTNNAIMLRLWKAEACESFDFASFNVGDYYGAVHEKVISENITKVLYPNDEPAAGKQLRLEQQYFFVSCSLQDMIRIFLQRDKDLRNFYKKYVIQLNDTHPAIAIPELMRILLDEHNFSWEDAWETTRRTFAYTNHTLMPEALEKWPVSLFGRLLPRHLEIIYELNRRFLEEVRLKFPGDEELVREVSLFEEGSNEKYIRMANLASLGSFSINGVAKLHTELLKKTVLNGFYRISPEKFNNKTNGVTPRRFIAVCNPELATLLTEVVGDRWLVDTSELRILEKYVEDLTFHERIKKIKVNNKRRLSEIIRQKTGIAVDPESLFAIQAKRIHEYKRQHLNVMHIIARYLDIKYNKNFRYVPRTFIFAGKAAPGYFMAKLIIKLINSVAEVINHDSSVKGLIKIVFLPDFNVKNAQPVYPAADLSEQISTAGKEASGTGNMKFAFNGALTIGTLDGANVEIREAVGAENFFLFGLTATEVIALKKEGYNPREIFNKNIRLRTVIDFIMSNDVNGKNGNIFTPLVNSLLNRDEYMLFADFDSYFETEGIVDENFKDSATWYKKSIFNIARMGRFSSDRAILEYNSDIWKAPIIEVRLDD
ncbi:MAG: glycogen/starch/alpha-glucan phosphorylase [Deltaproteobacteria bacterium]|nr:glycogen/starch/alpha-glucan phosphorylase [Deltaproteobacteria bacterium]